MQKGYNAYQQNNTMVESSEKLVTMLYEGILKFTGLAKRAMLNKDYEKKSYYISRTSDIYVELIASLDMKGGEIAEYLYGLYNYQLTLLAEANISNDVAKFDEALNVASVLIEAWREETCAAVA